MNVRPPAYRLNPLVGLVWARGWATVTGDRITLDAGDAVPYDLIRADVEAGASATPRSLLFDLAAVDSPHAASRFAQRWGFLWTGPNAEGYDEPVSEWLTHAERLRFILRLYLALKRSAESRSGEHTTALREIVAPHIEAIRRQSPTAAAMLEALDVERQAAVWICDLVNPVLGEVREGIIADGRLEYGEEGDRWMLGDPVRFHFAPNFTSLVAYAYHSLAQTISEQLDLFDCEHCGRVTPRRHGNQRFCGDHCQRASRDRAYRARGQSLESHSSS
jgi:hypothetical protein